MGIRDAIGERWARFRAYLHSIPPHVWIGLIIGAIALVLAYLAWKNRNQSLSPLSSLTPLSDTTTTTTTPGSSPVTLPSVPDLGNLIYPPAQYYNYNSGQTVKQSVPPSSAPAFNTQIGYDIHQQSLVQRAQAAAASLLQSASAPQHGYDIHAASQAQAAVKAAQNSAVYAFRADEIKSQSLTPAPIKYGPIPTARPVIKPAPMKITIPHPLKGLALTVPTQRGTNVSY